MSRNYTLTNPIKANGSKTKYFILLETISNNPGITKKHFAPRPGQNSDTFAALSEMNFIQYGLTKKGSIHITPKGERYLYFNKNKITR